MVIPFHFILKQKKGIYNIYGTTFTYERQNNFN